MLDAFHVVVPVAVHQIGDQTTSSLGQIIGILLDDVVERDALQQHHGLAIGSKEEAFHFPTRL